MTIIIYDGKKLVTDSGCTGGDMRFGQAKKHYILKDGSILACAGSLEDISMVIEWLKDEEQPRPVIEDFEAIRVYNNGSYKIYTEKLFPFVTSLPVFLGSGMPFAAGAYSVSKNALKSAKAACLCSLSCELPIIDIKFD
jgi:hypothetical protein